MSVFPQKMGCDEDDFGLRCLFLGIPFLVCGLIGMLCMTAGYVVNSNANNQLRVGNCVTQSWFIQQTRCTNTCCSKDHDGNCISCTFTCYNSVVYVNIADVAQNDPVTVAGGANTAADAQALLQVNYPIGGSFRCYYQVSNTSSVPIQLNLNDAMSSYIAGLFFLSAAALILLVWIVIEFCIFGIPCIAGCFDSCGDCCRNTRRQKREQKERERRERLEQEEQMERQNQIKLQEDSEIAAAAVIPPNAFEQPIPSAPSGYDMGLRSSEMGLKKEEPLQQVEPQGWWASLFGRAT